MAKLPDFNLGDPLKLLSHVLNDLVSFGPYLGTRNARKSIWASKASYSSLEYNQILSQNFGPLWR